MKDKSAKGISVTEGIRRRIQRLNWIIVLIIFIVLLLTVRYLYAFLDYIPMGSAVALMSVIAGLSVASYFLAKGTSTAAINAMEDYSRRIKALLMTTKNIQKIGYSDLLLENILDVSIEMTNAGGGSLVLVEGENLVFKFAKGGSAEKLVGHSIPRGQGIVGWVVQNGVPLRVNDARKDSRFYSGVDKMTGQETVSALCVPLVLGLKTIGALELINKEEGAFSLDDEEIMTYFADQAALSFERAKFREDDKNLRIHLTNILVEAVERISGKPWHARRVARYTLIMASALKLSDEERERLYRASMFLDIGYLKMDTRKITSAEDYRAHVKLGYEMLKPIEFFSDIAQVVLQHHERYDGTGYPLGLKGESILLESRIFAIAEAFDAMVSRHSYKNLQGVISRGVTPFIVRFNEAIQELRDNAGTQFDPKLVEVFAENVTEEDLD